METFSLFIKDFTHLDGAILDPQRGMIGFSYVLGIEFIGSVNEEGVVFDFSRAKKLAKKIVDDTADHALTVGSADIISIKDGIALVQHSTGLSYKCPESALFVVAQATESQLFSKLEQLIFDVCKSSKDCAQLKQVKLLYSQEKPSNEYPNFYHYTHGLKDSCSKCERPGHGHRSTIEIYVNEIRRMDLEKSVCDLYDDKQLVWNRNIIDEDETNITLAFKAGMGYYQMSLPKTQVLIYPIETTVENIAKVTAHLVKSIHGNVVKQNERVTVVAYEGLEKGCKYVLKDEFDDNLKIVVPKNEQNNKILLKG
jgi:6-pyruvoyl-tetrahydropterin synthase